MINDSLLTSLEQEMRRHGITPEPPPPGSISVLQFLEMDAYQLAFLRTYRSKQYYYLLKAAAKK